MANKGNDELDTTSPDRRRFLKGVAVGVASLTATPVNAQGSSAETVKSGISVPSSNRIAAESGPVSVVPPQIVKDPAADFMTDVFKKFGFPYVATNPGSSFEFLHESLINYGNNTMPELLTCLHEEIAVGMCHGYAKAEGKPIMALLHGTVGLMHASMAIYNAYADRVPVYIVAGNHREPSGGMSSYHSAHDLGSLVRDYVKWDGETTRLDRFAESAARAYKIAMQPPMGPVLISIDHELQGRSLPDKSNLPVPNIIQSSPPQGDATAVREAARMLVNAERPQIICERSARTQEGVDLLVELAELLQAPVNGGERLNFPTRHVLNDAAESGYTPDVILGLEVNDMFGSAQAMRRTGGRSINISSVQLSHGTNIRDYGRYADVDLAIPADAEATLPALIEEVRQLISAADRRRFAERGKRLAEVHATNLEQHRLAASYGWNASPCSTARVVSEVYAQVKNDDFAVVSPIRFWNSWPKRLWDMDKRYQYIGEQGAGGIGYGAPASIGAALANKEHGRLSINFQCDGDLNFTPGALWTAVHHKIPLLTVMHNNRAYHAEVMFVQRSAARHARGENRAHIGTTIRDPDISYTAMARAYGMYAEGPVEDPSELRGAFSRALARVREGEPALVDVITQPR